MLINLNTIGLLISTILILYSLSYSPITVNAISPSIIHPRNSIANLAKIHASSIAPGDYILADNHRGLLSVTPSGVVTTISIGDIGRPYYVVIDSHGNYIVTGEDGNLLSVTTSGVVTKIASSGLGNPYGVTVDYLGNYIVADIDGRLLSVTPSGVVTTIASSGLGDPYGVTVDSLGNYIVADYQGRLLSVTPSGVVTTIASSGLGNPYSIAIESHGNYIITDLNGRLLSVTPGGVVTTIASSGLGDPFGVTVDSLGNYIVADYLGNLLSVTPSGVVTTIASSGLGSPYSIVIDSHGNYIVPDLNGRLLSVTPSGVVTTIALGGGLGSPYSVTIESHGNYIVTDGIGARLLSVTPSGVVTTIASNGLGSPYSIVIDSHGNYIVTDYQGRLLSVTPSGVVTTIASSGLGDPTNIDIDSHGNYIVIDVSGNLLSVTPEGVVTTIATGFGLSLLDIAIVPQNIPGGNNNTSHARTSENIYNPPSIGNDYHNQYDGGIKINGKPFDIKNYTSSIPQQVLQIGIPTTLEFKIYDERGGNTVHHIGMYLHFNGDPSIINSDTWIIWDKNDGIEVHDPNKIFSKVHVDVKPEANYFYITFTVNPQKSMSDSNLVMRMWDDKLASEDVPILGAIVIVDQNAPVVVKKIPTNQYGDYVTLEQILDKDGYETPLLLNKLHNMSNDYKSLNIIWVYDKGIDKLTMVETDMSSNLVGTITCHLYKKVQQPSVTDHDYFYFTVQQLNRHDVTQEKFSKIMEEQKAVKLLESMGMLRTNNFS